MFGVFPARAGMIPPRWWKKKLVESIPRESGDDPQTIVQQLNA